MKSRPRVEASGRWRVPATGVMLAALVLAQCLGLVHAVHHAAPHRTASVLAAHAAEAASAQIGAVPTADRASLSADSTWSHDSDAAECRLFDPMVAACTAPARILAEADFATQATDAPRTSPVWATQRHTRPQPRAPPLSA